MSTLLDLITKRATETPDQIAYTFLEDETTIAESLTYQDLYQQSLVIATQLQQLGSTGDRVLLLYPPGLKFIRALFGCFFAGMVAVPAYPPRPNQSFKRLQSIVSNAQAKFVLTTRKIVQNKDKWEDLSHLMWLDTTSPTNFTHKNWNSVKITADTLALLQYTSGSTGDPKGVMVNHRNLMINCEDLDRGWNHNQDSKLVSWLPTFHDLGLVYGILTPVLVGFPCYLLSPLTFLLKPLNWLKIISRFQATHSAAPNFAYDLCVRKFKPADAKELNLSCWKMALNGAQRVRAETLESFSRTFAPYGFQPQTFSPGYGLAEATLKVAALRQEEKPLFLALETEALAKNQVKIVKADNSSLLTAETFGLNQDKVAKSKNLNTQIQVGCGSSEIDTQIQIIHPEHLTACQPTEIGEIWVQGATVAQGYWNNPQETNLTFQAYRRDTGEGPFLRTGDLGFLYQGQLFVTGRLKELIIIEGRNHYPQDIELTVEKSHPSLREGFGAAFSVEIKGKERLVVVQEIKRSYTQNLNIAQVKREIQEAIAKEHDLRVYQIVLIRQGSLSKTSSGKIQRRTCRQQFLNNQLNLLPFEQKSLVLSP